MTPPKRLVVLAPNWLGDAVMALPLLNDLRRAWPETRVTIAARGSVAALFDMVPDVADVIHFRGDGGVQAAQWRRDATLLRQGEFDAALLLPNSFLSAWLAARAGIPERWGFARDLRGRLLTRALPRPRGELHQAEYYQRLATGLGLPTGDGFAALAITDAARSRATELLAASGLEPGARFVAFAPGAAYGRAKQWLPERFAELAQLLAGNGASTVLVGTAADHRVCATIAKLAGPHATIVDLSGKTDLPTLAAVMSHAAAIVANDSGAMHLAAAVGGRVIGIFGPTNPRKTSPLRASSSSPSPVIVASDVWCQPCMLRECPIDHRCMRQISAQRVVAPLNRAVE